MYESNDVVHLWIQEFIFVRKKILDNGTPTTSSIHLRVETSCILIQPDPISILLDPKTVIIRQLYLNFSVSKLRESKLL